MDSFMSSSSFTHQHCLPIQSHLFKEKELFSSLNSEKRIKHRRKLRIEEPEEVQFEDVQTTPKFKELKKSNAQQEVNGDRQLFTSQVFMDKKKTKKDGGKDGIVKKYNSLQLSWNGEDMIGVGSSKQERSLSKSTIIKNKQLNSGIQTERISRRQYKAELIKNLQRKIDHLEQLNRKIGKINFKLSSHTKGTKSDFTPLASSLPGEKKLKKQICLNDFILLNRKGKGRFGEVIQAIHKATGAVVALKSQNKKQLIKYNLIDRFISEVKIQSTFNHRNICKIYGIFHDQTDIYMVMEYLNDGSLHFKIRNQIKSEKQASEAISDICSAVAELHENRIIHRDIKSENVVVCLGVHKLCDFGSSTIENGRRETYCGTFDYLPPQVLNGEGYDFSIDLWELGVLSYEIMTGKLPFYNIRVRQTQNRIKNFKNEVFFPQKISKEGIDFISRLIRKDPRERKPVRQLKKHPFLNKYRESLF